MAIKQFTFSFKLDAKDLFEYISERNVAVHIDAYGTASKAPKAKPKELPAPKRLALPAPRRRTRRAGAREAIMAYFVAHPKEGITRVMIKPILVEHGFSDKTANNAIWYLSNQGLIRHPKGAARGTYFATAKLLNSAEANNG